jgi:hypothetical protein
VWLREVASASWPPFSSAKAGRGFIGVSPSRCELELEFDDLSSLDEFWENLPQKAHAAWMRQAEVLVHSLIFERSSATRVACTRVVSEVPVYPRPGFPVNILQ